MRNTLICTVGTSLLGNISRANNELTEAFNQQNLQKLALLLLEVNNLELLCGAEINSITRICDQNLLTQHQRLLFLVSDTESGETLGKILKNYYQNSRNPIQFAQVEYRSLTGLRDDNVKAFQNQGLKNLVKEISQAAKKYSPETIAINATGGYKAQISFAGMIGQALGIPVYYLFEKFSEIIQLPPQPIALDLTIWLNYYPIFEKLETEDVIYKSELEMDITADNRLSGLIDQEPEKDDYLISLSAMGLLFSERCRFEFAKQEKTLLSLIPQDDTLPEKKKIKLSDDHHGNDTLLTFSKKLCQSPYVVEIVNSLPFNPHSKTVIRKVHDNGLIEFILTWTDAGFGVCIKTTGRNQAETNTIALHLEEKFAQ